MRYINLLLRLIHPQSMVYLKRERICLEARSEAENDIGRVGRTCRTLPVVRRLVTTFLAKMYDRIKQRGTTSSATSTSLVPPHCCSLRHVAQSDVLPLRPALLAYLQCPAVTNTHRCNACLCHIKQPVNWQLSRTHFM